MPTCFTSNLEKSNNLLQGKINIGPIYNKVACMPENALVLMEFHQYQNLQIKGIDLYDQSIMRQKHNVAFSHYGINFLWKERGQGKSKDYIQILQNSFLNALTRQQEQFFVLCLSKNIIVRSEPEGCYQCSMMFR